MELGWLDTRNKKGIGAIMFINNNGFAVQENDLHTKWINDTGRLDHDQWLLPQLLPYLKGVALDIGAHIGTHSIYYAQHCKSVVCFEPNPKAFVCLKHNTKNLHNVGLYNIALGAVPGSVDIVDCPGNMGASVTTVGTTIPVKPLDSISINECNFIKMDAEGDEVNILLGGKETILYFRPVMLIESNKYALEKKGFDQKELTRAIKRLGYSVTILQPCNVYPDQCDLLCLPQ